KLRILGLSVITDMCLPDALEPARLEEIIAVANEAEKKLRVLVRRGIAELQKSPHGNQTVNPPGNPMRRPPPPAPRVPPPPPRTRPPRRPPPPRPPPPPSGSRRRSPSAPPPTPPPSPASRPPKSRSPPPSTPAAGSGSLTP